MGEGHTEETAVAAPASERLRIADHKAPIGPLIAIGLVASAIGIAIGLLIDWFPVAASEQVAQVDTLYDVLIIASVPFFVLVTAVVLYSVYRFRMLPGEEDMDGPPIHGNTRLEIIWTAIPAALMLGMCVYAAILLDNAEEAPAAAAEELEVRVVGEQFTWTFFYPPAEEGGDEIASSQLYLPVDRSVNFTVQTKDVLHDFWVPAFRWKIDAVPGIDTSYRVTPNRIGTYPVVCAELCGLGHAVMRQTAVVMDEDDFAAQLEEVANPAPMEGDDPGAAVFTSNGCGGCHTLEASGTSANIGPNLDEVLAGQDDAMIKESIVDPEKELSAGFGGGIMPANYAETIPEADIDAMVTYLVESTKG